MDKVYIITRFDISNCSEHIVKVCSKKDEAKVIVDRLNRHSGEDFQYQLKSYIIDGDESYD